MKGNQLLSDVVVYNKYAKYIPELKRRETWDEIVSRYVDMMLKRYPSLSREIKDKAKFLYEKKVLMSMRAAQFSGAAVSKNEARVYNCSFMPVDDYRCFSESMFLLLTGCGVGYSVQYSHIDKLPEIQKPTKEKKFVISDSIEGWADAVKALMKAYFGKTKFRPRFDYSDIREKGARLVTSGGRAPGPDPLRICLVKVESILSNVEEGTKLTPLQVHDIMCHIADAVLAGGVRRAAMIALFSIDDKDMATCKHGNWWELNPQRGRANNSAVVLRNRVTKPDFDGLWDMIQASGSGEPGISFTDNPDWGFNPCHEIALRPYTFCNLTEIHAGNIEDEYDFFARCEAAAFFGTLQAGFTDFHYLRSIWRRNTEKDALVGVSMTGICNGDILHLAKRRKSILAEGADVVMRVNQEIAYKIGINPAARTTTIKPAGTTSCVLGTSSGIHSWHDKKFIRNMQCKVGDELYNFFQNNHPELIKVMDYDSNSAVIGVPLEAPEHSITREDETALEMLERVKRFNMEWVRTGHRSGSNFNNVSATCSIKDSEWEEVGAWMWENRFNYSGLSVLPFDGGTYKDAPFMEVSDEHFKSKLDYISNNTIDLTQIVESEDKTDLQGEIACGPQGCEVI